jgi:hypothetical protein
MRRRFCLVLMFACAVSSGPACHEGTTTATPTLSAQCSANPSSGPAPLTVAFVLDIAGAQGAVSVAINYGDGNQGTDPDLRHAYTAAGVYSASFTVSTATQTARCSAPVTVAEAPAPAPTPTPTPAVNRPPEAVFSTIPGPGSGITGTAPFTVQFNMCPTADPDGDRLYFRMDLDGDGAFEYHGSTGYDCRHEATYAVGTRTATLCVTDVDCPSWPLCEGLPPLHPFQCRSYTVLATP